MIPYQQIREAAQALLQAELRRIRLDGRRELVQVWATKLQPPSAKTKHLSSEDHLLFEGENTTDLCQCNFEVHVYVCPLHFDSRSCTNPTTADNCSNHPRNDRGGV